ncbi:hypothetical protein BOH66_02520 [Microbacterium aurum]|uniref:Uncharacterized protein n=1 Tax=Microbacterium aurum TaxID=36805 RepID=A0A1P8U595_9MICO|nr:hypothetical protein [Microbacterium aurum]APZ33285.1 hypothetical protein BOH66_02520 [Microbacterium aurum]MBM7826902.1 hypothetical protein [Microbacterium aurum]
MDDTDARTPGAARTEGRGAAARAWRLANPERARESRNAWRERHPEQARALTKAWKDAHPERNRELNRDSARRRAAREKALAAGRARARDRARTRREADPDGVREYKRRWYQAHPDKAREYSRRYYATHRAEALQRAIRYRDRHPEATKARVQDWASRHPEYAANYQRAYRQDPEKYAKALQANRDARRLARRLQAAALPPKQIRRTPAAERRANQRDADRFFTSPDVREHYKQYDAFEFALDTHVRTHAADLRTRAQQHIDGRARAGLPAQTLHDALFVQAIWDVVATGIPVDTLTPEDLTRAVAYVTQTHARRRREQQFSKVVSTVQNYTKRHTDQLRKEADLENRARAIAGKTLLDVDVLAHRIAFDLVKDRLNLQGLSEQDIAKALNLAREAHPLLFDTTQTGPVTSPPAAMATPSRQR